MKEGKNKNFDQWNNLKKELQNISKFKIFDKKEIWWCSLGINVGVEQNGKNKNFERPVLVFRKFNKDSFWALPLTSRDKTGKFYYQIEYKNKKYSIILSQIRLVSSKRLLRRIRKIDNSDFYKIGRKLKKLV